MNKMQNQRLGETILEYDHASGLKVVVIPKPGYANTYAMFAANFGSVDNCFRLNGEEQRVPDGIAHFLEHKLFDNEDGNAFEKYAKTGASANAFTSFDKTAYLFSAADHVMESLDILVDFVTHPYFTKESVQKEQGIIGQEIRMYDDDGEWRVQFNLLKALYEHNPVAIDIAGTVESISHITHQTLYDCYNTFYNLHNMVLCVVGDVKPEEVLAVCDRHLKPAPKLDVQRIIQPDEKTIVQDYIEQKLSVAAPLFQIGFKDTADCFAGREYIRREVELNILLEMIAGRGSDFFERLYQQGLLNSQFGTEYMSGRGYGVTIFAGESQEPEKVRDELLAQLDMLGASDNRALYERSRRVVYAACVRQFNSVDEIAHAYISCHFMGASLFDMVDIFDEITYESVMHTFRQVFCRDKMALSVVRPAN